MTTARTRKKPVAKNLRRPTAKVNPKQQELDMVNHPPHYTASDIECIDAIRAQLTIEEFRGYCKGCSAKYIWREKYKGGNESLAKANWYLTEAQK